MKMKTIILKNTGFYRIEGFNKPLITRNLNNETMLEYYNENIENYIEHKNLINKYCKPEYKETKTTTIYFHIYEQYSGEGIVGKIYIGYASIKNGKVVENELNREG